jgi:hypothetical protein
LLITILVVAAIIVFLPSTNTDVASEPEEAQLEWDGNITDIGLEAVAYTRSLFSST